MRKTILSFGLRAGGVLSALMLMALPFRDQIGFDNAIVVGYTTMVLAFLMVYFGIRSYRDNAVGGRLAFGRALLVGLGITAIATVCYVATWEVIYYRLAPDYGEAYAAYQIEKARKAGASDGELAARAAEMAEFEEKYRNPVFNVAITFLEPLPVGLLASLLSAGLLTRRKSTLVVRAEGIGAGTR
jgi:hypothetical protein